MSAVPSPMLVLARIGPLAQLRAGRLPRRLTQLYGGLLLYGFTLALMIRSALGNAPWDVLHQGLAKHLPLTIGEAVIVVSFIVLLAWIPLREIPGLGTISNAIVIGLAADLGLSLIGPATHLGWQVLFLLTGLLGNGLATALYIGAQFGAGPRDGLMTGLHRRTGLSIRLVRSALEFTVVVIGFFLGGRLGVGTVLYALAIGPMVQAWLPRCVVSVE